MAKPNEVRFGDPDRFLRFCRLYFQRQGLAAAARALQAHMAQQLQALDADLAAVARHEGIPVDQALTLDAQHAAISWEESGA